MLPSSNGYNHGSLGQPICTGAHRSGGGASLVPVVDEMEMGDGHSQPSTPLRATEEDEDTDSTDDYARRGRPSPQPQSAPGPIQETILR
jgi:hypothetical protein